MLHCGSYGRCGRKLPEKIPIACGKAGSVATSRNAAVFVYGFERMVDGDGVEKGMARLRRRGMPIRLHKNATTQKLPDQEAVVPLAVALYLLIRAIRGRRESCPWGA